ncbi:MAG: flagellar biosynthesis anti-sigma factor FlgM [Proteobacteria bacterium]|nr:flagellar biosynthesis anti-sigma factor FlgM [Pseudomonadota bacterium]
MVNEIKGLHSSAVKSLTVANQQQTDKRNATAQRQENRSSSVQYVSLTDTSAKLRELEAKIASQPVVDTQRVENIKKTIADGTFRVNVTRTAEKMAQFESLLATKVGDK